ncbi:hypothetical protein FA13DRAFT_222802 [Coprinellus micaceus]|uniref:DUF6535 domain-containing protein n=1 Tax=Coprinellus micaceus TaxID=71717 RepID=A0A4Y7TFC6_COPMI|nr:hypothetical protein FA13DRAFT_222802 [Coprinellus micaceus]
MAEEPTWNNMMNPEMHFPLPPQSEEPWGRCVSLISEHDKELCAGWTEEINIMLVFAALFSAIVTAFLVECLKDIREDPAHTSAQLLYQILAQMRNASTDQEPELPPVPEFSPPASAIWINSLWGVSLALSLLAVMLCILCLQWLRAFRRSHPGLSRDRTLAMRQMKYEGLNYWGTPPIVSSIPIILLSSLFLFLAGLAYYIYDSSAIVAIPLIVLTGIIAVIFGATTLLPGIIDLSNLISSTRN